MTGTESRTGISGSNIKRPGSVMGGSAPHKSICAEDIFFAHYWMSSKPREALRTAYGAKRSGRIMSDMWPYLRSQCTGASSNMNQSRREGRQGGGPSSSGRNHRSHGKRHGSRATTAGAGGSRTSTGHGDVNSANPQQGGAVATPAVNIQQKQQATSPVPVPIDVQAQPSSPQLSGSLSSGGSPPQHHHKPLHRKGECRLPCSGAELCGG